MTIKLLDLIEVIKDVPAQKVRPGAVGTVVDVYTNPNLAYEVEFFDHSGRERALIALLPDQVRKIANITKEERAKRLVPETNWWGS